MNTQKKVRKINAKLDKFCKKYRYTYTVSTTEDTLRFEMFCHAYTWEFELYLNTNTVMYNLRHILRKIKSYEKGL